MKVDENIRFKPWKKKFLPRKILVMRFQALGDTVITLPYLQSLKRRHPEIQLHFLTRNEVCAIPKNINLFDKVIAIGGGRNIKFQLIFALFKLPYLWFQRYDVVVDLQNHKLSKVIRQLMMVKCWTEFDRYSPKAAGERVKNTIESLAIWKVDLDTNFTISNDPTTILLANRWKPDHSLVVLNPSGSMPSRNWPSENYVSFANLWLKSVNSKTQFVLLLLPSLIDKANCIEQVLGKKCINLTGKANQEQAFSILQKCTFVLSEDSGLMHMAWVQKIPTLALFSSSRKDWSAPQGDWSACLDSSDLDCGPCLLPICKYGDNRCLTRYTPELVVAQAKILLGKNFLTTSI